MIARWLRRIDPMAFHGSSHPTTGTCPFGYGKNNAAAGPTVHNAALRGPTIAEARPALGLALDESTHEQVSTWAEHHGGACVDRHGALECSHVAVESGLAITTVWFTFNHKGTLDSIRSIRSSSDATPVESTFASLVSDISRRAGEPMHGDGSADASDLAAGALRQAAVEYRFTNYRAVLRATNMGDHYTLTEEYATLVD